MNNSITIVLYMQIPCISNDNIVQYIKFKGTHQMLSSYILKLYERQLTNIN